MSTCMLTKMITAKPRDAFRSREVIRALPHGSTYREFRARGFLLASSFDVQVVTQNLLAPMKP